MINGEGQLDHVTIGGSGGIADSLQNTYLQMICDGLPSNYDRLVVNLRIPVSQNKGTFQYGSFPDRYKVSQCRETLLIGKNSVLGLIL